MRENHESNDDENDCSKCNVKFDGDHFDCYCSECHDLRRVSQDSKYYKMSDDLWWFGKMFLNDDEFIKIRNLLIKKVKVEIYEKQKLSIDKIVKELNNK